MKAPWCLQVLDSWISGLLDCWIGNVSSCSENFLPCNSITFFLPDRATPVAGYGKEALHRGDVRHMVSDVKMLTMRELNRKTASVLDAVERGETFELRRNGRAVGYITRTPPAPHRQPDWKAHFDWLRQKATKDDIETLTEFEQERRREAAREAELGNPK